jgi:hypothetical protein
MEDQRRQVAVKEAASRRTTDAQVLEDAERPIAAWNERQALRAPMIFSPTIGARLTTARTSRPMPIVWLAALKLTPSRAWRRACGGSAYQVMTIREGKTIATKASGDSALCCFAYPFALHAACLSAFLCLAPRGLPGCTQTRKATDHTSAAKIAMLTSHFASSAVICPIP